MELPGAQVPTAGFNSLPDELLENVLCYLCVYRDFGNLRLVCRRWNAIITGLARRAKNKLEKAVVTGDICWQLLSESSGNHGSRWITERYAQCACYHGKALYVFGGCTPTATTYNDVWMFDLADHTWIRPVMSGTYPPPKAYASMVVWQNVMIVFGGWSPPNAYPLHQAALFFNHLHIYSPELHSWSLVLTDLSPPPTAGHCACVVTAYNKMIVFGGSHRYGSNTNELWILDLPSMMWEEAVLCPDSSLPPPRYGASANALDGEHILVLGGCRGGPDTQLADVWLLTAMDGGHLWHWKQLEVRHPESGPFALWCYPTCTVGDKVVALCRSKQVAETPAQPQVGFRQPSARGRGSNGAALPERQYSARHATGGAGAGTAVAASASAAASSSRLLAASQARRNGSSVSNPSSARCEVVRLPTDGSGQVAQMAIPNGGYVPVPGLAAADIPALRADVVAGRGGSHVGSRVRTQHNRQRQLEVLSRYEERLGARRRENEEQVPEEYAQLHQPNPAGGNGAAVSSSPAIIRGAMQLQMLDTSTALSCGYVTWLEPSRAGARSTEGIGERSFYSLVQARGELVLFGGIRPNADPGSRPVSPDGITNSVVLIRPLSVSRSE